jgi:hypothetical protein
VAGRVFAFFARLDRDVLASRVRLAEFTTVIRAASRQLMDAATDEWERLVRQRHAAFWSCHEHRQEGIRRLLEMPAGEVRQVGLFDRRAARKRASEIVDRAELLEAFARRNAATRRLAASLDVHDALMLVLLPCGGTVPR